MSIGERIRKLREARRLTQGELADMINGDGNTISRWERNKLGVGATNVMKLAQALETSTDYLLGKTDDPSPNYENTQESTPAPVETMPYTQEQINKGMLVYTLSNGERIELPPIKESYDFLRDMAVRAARVAVL